MQGLSYTLLENCSLLGINNLGGHVSEYISTPNGGYSYGILALLFNWSPKAILFRMEPPPIGHYKKYPVPPGNTLTFTAFKRGKVTGVNKISQPCDINVHHYIIVQLYEDLVRDSLCWSKQDKLYLRPVPIRWSKVKRSKRVINSFYFFKRAYRIRISRLKVAGC